MSNGERDQVGRFIDLYHQCNRDEITLNEFGGRVLDLFAPEDLERLRQERRAAPHGALPSEEAVEAVAAAIAFVYVDNGFFDKADPKQLAMLQEKAGRAMPSWKEHARAAISAHQKATGGDPRGDSAPIPPPSVRDAALVEEIAKLRGVLRAYVQEFGPTNTAKEVLASSEAALSPPSEGGDSSLSPQRSTSDEQ